MPIDFKKALNDLQLIKNCEENIIAFDIETTGKNALDPYQPNTKAFTYAICFPNGKSSVIDKPECIQDFLNHCNKFKTGIIAHNYHYEYAVLKQMGFEIPENLIWHDTIIEHQLLLNLKRHGLDVVSQEFCTNVQLRLYWQFIDNQISFYAKKNNNDYSKIPKWLMHRYQINDVERTMLLHLAMYPEIVKRNLLNSYHDEIEVVKEVYEMEAYGIQVDKIECKKLIEHTTNELKKVDQEVQKIIKYPINLNSPKQLNKLLFDQLKIKPIGKDKNGQYSVDNENLGKLIEKELNAHVALLLDLILKCRAYTKGKATIESYLKLMDENEIIHPHIGTNVAATGRPSCTKPNLFNVSKEKALLTKYPIPARKCFRARKNRCLYLFDEKGIELRLIVEHTQEPEFVKLINENGDPHDLAAQCFYGDIYTDHVKACNFYATQNKDFSSRYHTQCLIFDLYKEAKKALRGAAKNAHFAMAYMDALKRHAEILGLTIDQAKPGRKTYEKRFPLVASFGYKMMNEAKARGHVVTSMGRKLCVPINDITAAGNYRIQGTAAEVLKRAVINAKFLRQKYDAHILLPIYDELIFDTPIFNEQKEKLFIIDVRKVMTNISFVKTPLDIECKKSLTTWFDAKEIKI